MNRLKLLAIAFLFSFSLVSCEKDDNSVSNNDLENYDFALTGAQVVPASNSSAGGTIKGTYNPRLKVFSYTIAWNGLSGTVTGIHIHGVADRGFVAIPVPPLAAYPSGIVQTITGFSTAASGSYSGSLFVDGTVVREQDLLAGKFYVDIHTAAFPAGEVRGQILFP
jgi:hypothetical protein